MTNGQKLSKAEFQRLKDVLLVEFRFYLRGPKTNIYWSKTYNGVAIRYRRGMVNYQVIKERISSFIYGFYTALEIKPSWHAPRKG